MKDLYLHETSRLKLQALEKALPHCILLSGKRGVGLKTIALRFAKKYDTTHLFLEPNEKDTIAIDIVRRLYSQTKSKKSFYQFVVIDEAEKMPEPAQNALLKLLEEPPDKTIFILTSHYPQLLLSTIRSRAQEVTIASLTKTDSLALLDNYKTTDPTIRSQLLFMACGLPTELLRLVDSADYFAARSQSMRQARQFIAADTYQKLIMTYQLAKSRDNALELVRSSSMIILDSLKKKPSKDLAILLQKFLGCEEKLLTDGNVRIQLLALSVSS